jgi:hypothetical protein|tara:strand:- start:159 stop:332 length:174 start_codon:yes stop_codon:yes gene_type:complete
MAKKIPEELANELWKAINRLEYATELLKMWVEYMDSDLSEAEEILVNKSKEFLGEKK